MKKKNGFSFCISLTYSYLCSENENCIGKMSRIKNAFSFLWNLPYLKYCIVVVVGVGLVGFVGDNSVMAHLRNVHRIGELQDEIDDYTARYQRDVSRIKQLNDNPRSMEKIARERYFMKCPDEDIFVLSDDERNTESAMVGNETVD